MATEYFNLFMNLPSVKNYVDGCESGKAAGQAYLKYIKTDELPGSLLQHVIIKAMESYASLSNEEQQGLHGHIVGMCNYISDLVQHRSFADDLIAQMTAEELAEDITKAENNFHMNWYQEKFKRERSENARRAANKRWEKHRQEKLNKVA